MRCCYVKPPKSASELVISRVDVSLYIVYTLYTSSFTRFPVEWLVSWTKIWTTRIANSSSWCGSFCDRRRVWIKKIYIAWNNVYRSKTSKEWFFFHQIIYNARHNILLLYAHEVVILVWENIQNTYIFKHCDLFCNLYLLYNRYRLL